MLPHLFWPRPISSAGLMMRRISMAVRGGDSRAVCAGGAASAGSDAGRVHGGDRLSPQANWRGRHARRLAEQAFAHPAHHTALQEALNAARGAAEQVKRLEAALVEIVPTWSMAPVVDAFQAMRGVGFVAAVIFVAELGDFRRLTISPKDEKHTGRLRNRDHLPAFGTRAGGGAGVMIGLSR